MQKTKALWMLIGMYMLCSCKTKESKCNPEGWIKEAPIALEEYYKIEKEVFSNRKFVSAHSYPEGLFLRGSDTTDYKSYALPLLLKWFKDGRGYINFRNDSTESSFAYRQCAKGIYTSNATVFLHKKIELYKSQVKITDTMNLRNGAYAVITTCTGCND